MKLTDPKKLEILLAQSAQDPSLRPLFYQTLLNAVVYFHGRAPAGSDTDCVASSECEELILHTTGDAEGVFIPFFSSRENLRVMFGEEALGVGLCGRDLLRITEGQRLVFNCRQPIGKEFSPVESVSILVSEGKLAIHSADYFYTTVPGSPETAKLLEAVATLLAEYPSITAAYLQSKTVNIGNSLVLLPKMYIVSAEEMPRDYYEKIGERLLVVMRQQRRWLIDADFVGVGGSAFEVEPFYQRQGSARSDYRFDANFKGQMH